MLLYVFIFPVTDDMPNVEIAEMISTFGISHEKSKSNLYFVQFISVKTGQNVYFYCKFNVMKVSDYVSNRIDRLPKGYVFTYMEFITDVNKREAVIKALNRLVLSGKIVKLSKGKYYKAETTPFGNLQPSQEQIVKDLLDDNGRVIGYLTGYSVYNLLGLTTQVSSIIQIGKNKIRSTFKRGNYTILFMQQKNVITKDNVRMLQILDTLKTIKKIPDSSVENSCERLFSIINNISEQEKKAMLRLALKYPPSTKALLGAIFDELNEKTYADSLYEELNPISKYRLKGVENVLTEYKKWNFE